MDTTSVVTYGDPIYGAIVYWGEWEYDFKFVDGEWFLSLHSVRHTCHKHPWFSDPLAR